MSLAYAEKGCSAEAYLVAEAQAEHKHEFYFGEIFAMSGAGDRHVRVALNTAMCLTLHLRGSGCGTYISDMKVGIGDDEAFFYPDVMVTCSERDRAASHVKREPLLIVEVLSPSTESFDRSKKFEQYRRIPTLREYLLIDPDRIQVDLYRLNAGGHWELYSHARADEELELASVGLRLPVAELYQEVEFGDSLES